MLEHKRWSQLVRPGTWHHLAIILFSVDRPARLHTHDFPEVFWLEKGEGRHHINGEDQRIEAGDLIFIRPEDEHRLEATDARGFTLINLAYHPRVRADLLRRHRSELEPLLAPTTALPQRTRLPKALLPILRAQLSGLTRAPDSRLALEHFLLGLHQQTQPRTPEDLPPMPDWLLHACDELQRPEVFARGAPGLTKVAGRSAEHVARTVRAVLGMTPSDYVNRVRMDYAARELRVTGRPIADIALDCGLSNLSHFYALFRAAHGQTPRAYRVAHHRTVA